MTDLTPITDNNNIDGMDASLSCPTEKYLPLIDDLDVDYEDAIELLNIIWSMCISLADLGLGLDPVSQLVESLAPDSPDQVHLKSLHPTTDFKSAACPSDVPTNI